MVVEYIRYRVPAERHREFFALVKPFFNQIEEMRHHELTAIVTAP
jgi:hypothetical protein